jgi:hypothetical protein
VLLPIVLTTLVAFASLPAPRYVAWVALFAVTAEIGRRVSRSAGMFSAAIASLAYMFAHGRPRFASTVTDQLTIRASFLLGILGVTAAVVADWRAHRAPAEHARRSGSSFGFSRTR